MQYYDNLASLIGHTPILKWKNLFCKLENLNPTGSAKDRAARFMLDAAEKSGVLTKDTPIVEPTSGNTGIGLAALAAARGYRIILTMPDTMSLERRKMLQAYGAEIVLTPGADGMQGAVKEAEKLQKELHAFMPNQFQNPNNALAHYETTGPEIWQALDGHVDVFVAGVGTGGTLAGSGKYLREKNHHIEIIAVEPASSPVLQGGKPGKHALQGIGANFFPPLLTAEEFTRVIGITNQAAYRTGKDFSQSTGLLIGISGGAALAAALELQKDANYTDKNIVVVIPDNGNRYLSTADYLV